MRPIKNIQDLQAEKIRLEQHHQLLEQNIQTNWNVLKGSFNPLHVAKEVFSNALSAAPALMLGGSIPKIILNYGIGFLTKKLADKGLGKLGSIFRKKQPDQ